MTDDIKYKFIIDVGSSKPYYYTGIIIQDKDDTITIFDDRIGTVEINKKRIIAKEAVKQ